MLVRQSSNCMLNSWQDLVAMIQTVSQRWHLWKTFGYNVNALPTIYWISILRNETGAYCSKFRFEMEAPVRSDVTVENKCLLLVSRGESHTLHRPCEAAIGPSAECGLGLLQHITMNETAFGSGLLPGRLVYNSGVLGNMADVEWPQLQAAHTATRYRLSRVHKNVFENTQCSTSLFIYCLPLTLPHNIKTTIGVYLWMYL